MELVTKVQILKSLPVRARLLILAELGQVASLALWSPGVLAVQAPVVEPVAPELSNTSQLVQQGRSLYEAGRFSAAIKPWQQAAQAYQAQGNQLGQAKVLSNLSLAYQQLGQWSQATQAITASLRRLQAGQNKPSTERSQILAQALNTQGSLQLARGQAEQALATWQQATTIYTQARDDSGAIGSLINQAQALQALGLYQQVLTKLTRVNQTLEKQPNSLLKVAGLRSLGNALYAAGDLDQSRQILQQSLAMAQQLQSAPDIGVTLFSLGNTARAQQDTPAALAFYQQAATSSASQATTLQAQLNRLSLLLETEQWPAAQALWPQIQAQVINLPASRTAVDAQINFAQSLTRLKQASAAAAPTWPDIAQLMATAVKQAKNLQDPRAEAYALGALGRLYEQTQQFSSAQDLTRQALLLAQATNAADIAYRWQWQLGRLLKAEGNTQGAIAAYTQAVNTLQSLRGDLVARSPDVQFSFQESVEPVYRQLVELLLQSRGEPSQQNLLQARQVIESLQLAELDNFFRAACLFVQPVLIDQIVDQDNPKAAVIYPIILADRLEVILKLPRQPLRHYSTPVDRTRVERTSDQLRQNLTKPHTLQVAQSLSRQMYDWLLRPLEADLVKSQVETLVFVLDGSLRNIPMAALYDGQQYLVEKYEIALTPGLQLINPQALNQSRLQALTAGLAESRYGFQKLSYVKNELAQIQAELPSKVLLNQQFTTQALQEQINSQAFSVVHLATHGQFSSNADQTFILAWDKFIKVNELHTLLQTRDLGRLSPIELLVLSACETAAGDRRAALGLAGVAVRAGARSTLASLWSLDDQSTALLMSQFYQELTQSPQVTKAAALRRAQLALLHNPKYKRPMFWAPYVLVGNWR